MGWTRTLAGTGGAWRAATVAAAVLIWREFSLGHIAAGLMMALNLAVLGRAGYLFRMTGFVAVDGIRATGFRSMAWLVIFGVPVWIGRRRRLST